MACEEQESTEGDEEVLVITYRRRTCDQLDVSELQLEVVRHIFLLQACLDHQRT